MEKTSTQLDLLLEVRMGVVKQLGIAVKAEVSLRLDASCTRRLKSLNKIKKLMGNLVDFKTRIE